MAKKAHISLRIYDKSKLMTPNFHIKQNTEQKQKFDEAVATQSSHLIFILNEYKYLKILSKVSVEGLVN